MGGCCCSANKPHMHGSTAFYYYPQTLEDHDTFSSRDGPLPTITSGLLVDPSLEESIPDNFRAPPPPLPYDVVLPSRSTEPADADHKLQPVHLVILPKKLEELSKSDEIDTFGAADEDDCCPICLEEYDKENPRLLTKCEHHFHLCCILEWMERSDICPICDKVLVLDHSFAS